MRVYQQHLEEWQKLGAQLVAVSPMLPDNSLSFAEKLELKFETLSDAGNKVARDYGLQITLPPDTVELYKKFGLDIPGANGDDSWELPVPGTYVLDKDGTVKLAFADVNHTVRLEPSAIEEALKAL